MRQNIRNKEALTRNGCGHIHDATTRLKLQNQVARLKDATLCCQLTVAGMAVNTAHIRGEKI